MNPTNKRKRGLKREKRDRIFRRDGWACCYCGRSVITKALKLEDLTLDHIKPRSKGGSDEYNNLCTACRDCNQIKGDRTLKQLKLKRETKRKFTRYEPPFAYMHQ